MVASLLSSAAILSRPSITARRQAAALVREFSPSEKGMRFIQASGAEVISKGIDEKTMSFPAIISTDEVDRVGDILVSEGCEYEAYSQNALVFLNHQAEHIPIGTCWDDDGKFYFSVEPHRVLARCFCVQGGKYGQDAADIFHLIVNRAFNDVSVGFNPNENPRYTQPLDTGGHRYIKWEIVEWGPVGVACNRGAKIIRKYLTDGRITGKYISPRLTKCLSPFAEPKIEQVVGGFAASSPSSAQSPKRGKPMSKKWGKPNRKKRGAMSTPANEAESAVAVEETKAMTEASGTDGGYLTKEEDAVEEKLPEETAEEREEDAEGKDEAGSGEEQAEEVEETESDEDKTTQESEGEEVTKALETEYKRKAQIAYHLGRGSVYKGLAHALTKEASSALEACVQHKIPKIAEDHPEMENEQRVAVAYSMCGEKFFGGYIAKDAAVPAEDEPLPGEPDQPIPEEDSQNKVPPNLQLCQQAIENIEAALPGLEPANREFWSEMLQEIRDHGKEHYPDEDFGGENTGEEQSDSREAHDFADEVTDAYRKRPETEAKRQAILYRKSMRVLRKGEHPEVLRAAADHHHAMGDKPLGYTLNKADKAMCKEHGRALDRLHGAVTAYMKKEDEPEEEETETPEEEQMEREAGKTQNESDDKVPEGTEDESTHEDESVHVVEKLFASTVGKDFTPTNGDHEDAEQIVAAFRERMTNIFGTRF